MKTAKYSELKSNLEGYLDCVAKDSEPLKVYRPNNESIVIIPLEEYNAIKETEQIMKSPAMMDIIRKGDDEIEADGGTAVDVKSLWK